MQAPPRNRLLVESFAGIGFTARIKTLPAAANSPIVIGGVESPFGTNRWSNTATFDQNLPIFSRFLDLYMTFNCQLAVISSLPKLNLV